MRRSLPSLVRLMLLGFVMLIINPMVLAFPKKRLALASDKTEFSRERVKLQQQQQQSPTADDLSFCPEPLRSSLISRDTLIKFDVLVGVIYATGFLLFPGRTLSLFFQYDFDPSITKFLHMAVRMIAINHLGYLAGLLSSPPKNAIRIATAFLTIGGAFVVYYGQIQLETATAFWCCTILTSMLILLHLLAL